LKLKAAERREAEAKRLRAEAAELLRLWHAYQAGRDAAAQTQAEAVA
jgi:hypothetical protein